MSLQLKPLLSLSLLLYAFTGLGQIGADNGGVIAYEEIYDEPYEINKLFVHFQPLYGELFATNVTVGFGVEAQYYLKDKADFKAQLRIPYARPLDTSRDIAKKNSEVANTPKSFKYFEAGFTYHIIDKEQQGSTKITWYNKRTKDRKWAATMPYQSKIPCRVRKIVGARLGALYWESSTDLRRAMEKQGTSLVSGTDSIPSDISVFGNVNSLGIYVGGSLSWIKNIAVKPDKTYSITADDLMITVYADIIYSPSISIEDIIYNDISFSSDPIETANIGFRAGIEGKFNREFGWAYGAEIGSRPSVSSRTFFALIKISFPVFSTDLEKQQVTAIQRNE